MATSEAAADFPNVSKRACPMCGEPVSLSAKTCGACGEKIDDTASRK